MTKYCMKCGARSDDDSAAFCSSCGERFSAEPGTAAQVGQATQQQQAPPPSSPPPPPQPPGAPEQPQVSLFTTEQGEGAHKHISTDIYLKDAQGAVALVARRQSLLHEDYTIVDRTESPVGYIGHKSHLSHSSFGVEDRDHIALGSVNLSSMREKGVPPGCWVEDASGNKQATVSYMDYLFAFSLTGLDGTTIFEASSAPRQGVRQAFSNVEHKSHSVRLFDQGFLLPVLLAIFVAVDTSG